MTAWKSERGGVPNAGCLMTVTLRRLPRAFVHFVRAEKPVNLLSTIASSRPRLIYGQQIKSGYRGARSPCGLLGPHFQRVRGAASYRTKISCKSLAITTITARIIMRRRGAARYTRLQTLGPRVASRRSRRRRCRRRWLGESKPPTRSIGPSRQLSRKRILPRANSLSFDISPRSMNERAHRCE